MSSANIAGFVERQAWEEERWLKRLKREMTRDSNILSEANVEKIREATRRIKHTRNASKSITGSHFSVNLRAKVVEL